MKQALNHHRRTAENPDVQAGDAASELLQSFHEGRIERINRNGADGADNQTDQKTEHCADDRKGDRNFDTVPRTSASY